MSEMADTALKLSGLCKDFKQGNRKIEVLRGIDMTLQSGDSVALLGPSGAGKSTLLHLAGLLENPSAGQIEICGVDVSRFDDNKQTALRREHIGFVYQFHNLLPEFTALENVSLPLRLAGQSRKYAEQRAADLLELLSLGERMTHYPGQLSGGEQQRVAIARALANQPALLLADEPTGSLDPQTGEAVFKLLVDVARQQGTAVLVATHNPVLAAQLDRQTTLTDGKLS